MPELPRGICPRCGANRALRANGTLRSHNRLTPQGYRIGLCPGTDEPPSMGDLMTPPTPHATLLSAAKSESVTGLTEAAISFGRMLDTEPMTNLETGFLTVIGGLAMAATRLRKAADKDLNADGLRAAADSMDALANGVTAAGEAMLKAAEVTRG